MTPFDVEQYRSLFTQEIQNERNKTRAEIDQLIQNSQSLVYAHDL
jgi:hypothetical protein